MPNGNGQEFQVRIDPHFKLVHIAEKGRFVLVPLSPMHAEIARELARALLEGADRVSPTTPKRRRVVK